MYDQLEAEVAQALMAQASTVPADAAQVLRTIDYHPRTARVGWRAASVVAGATATTGAVISAVVLGSSQAAFAGWTPAPSAASAPQAATTSSNCLSQLEQGPLAASASGSGWTALDTDVRGPYTVVIYEDGDLDATCFAGPSFTVVDTSSPDGSSGSFSASGSASGGAPSASGPNAGGNPPASVSSIGSGPSGDLEHLSEVHLNLPGQGPYTLIEGETQPGVTAVTIVRSDGEDVQASFADQLFVAWWPGSLDATSAQLTTASGTTTQPISTAPVAPPKSPPGSCTSSPTSGAGSSATTAPAVTSVSNSGGGPAVYQRCSYSGSGTGPKTTSAGGSGGATVNGGTGAWSSISKNGGAAR